MKLRSAIFTSFLLLSPAVANPAEAQVKLKTRTSVGVSDATAVFGESVTLSATVKLVTGGSPVGIVKFKDVTAGALLGSAPLDAKGVATLVVTSRSRASTTFEARSTAPPIRRPAAAGLAWWSVASTSSSARTRDRW